MDTTLRYVQQFGRSKKDNLKPSLTNKYHVGQTIEVFPFRIMDFGCFASTADGLSGLLHNSEMAVDLQGKLPELIEREASIEVRITKYDRRSGEVAFTMEGKEKDLNKEAAATPTVADAIALPEVIAPTVVTAIVAQAGSTTAFTSASSAPAAPEAAVVPAASTAQTAADLAPHQFTTSQPVPSVPTRDSLSVRLDQELADIQKFIEGVTKTSMSEKAQKLLRELLEQHNTFRLTYSMQTVVDDFDPDLNFLLVSLIEKALKNPTP
jgi:predicted RNA-binding protein with RPS1 domain